MASLSAITGASGNALKTFQDKINETANETKTSAVEMTKAFELVGSAKPELLKSADGLAAVTKSAVILSQASGDELSTSVQSLTGTLNQFELGANSATKVIDMLAAGSQAGAAAIPLITESLDKFGTVAKSLNIGVAESVALIETLAEKNIKGAEAGTKLRNILTKLATAKSLPAEALKQMESFGVNTDIVSDSSLSLKQRLTELSKIQNDATALAKVFGTENLVAGQVLLQNVGKVESYTEAINKSGIAQEQADKNTATLSARLDQLKARWDNLFTSTEQASTGLNIFKGLIVLITDNIEILAGAGLLYVGALVALKTVTISLTIATGLFSVAQGIMAGVMGTSALAFEAGSIGYIAYRTATLAGTAATWLGVAAMTAFNFVMALNPIGLVIIGIGLLVAAIYWLTDGFEGFGDFFMAMWDGIVDFFIGFAEIMILPFTTMISIVTGLFQIFNPFQFLRDKMNDVLPGLGDDVFSFFGGMFEGLYLIFIQPLVSAWNLIAGAFGKTIDTSGLDAATSKLNGLDKTINANANVNVDEATINAQSNRQETLVRSIEERNQNLNIDINDGTGSGVSVKSSGDSIAMPTIKPSFG
jgi:TP901 family phage tail tape measure protein